MKAKNTIKKVNILLFGFNLKISESKGELLPTIGKPKNFKRHIKIT